MRYLLLSFLLLSSVCATGHVHACDKGAEFIRSFDSGASWRFCASLDEQHALSLGELQYRAPGGSSRVVLESVHLAQVLVHHHDHTEPVPLIGTDNQGSAASFTGAAGLGGAALVELTNNTCPGELHSLDKQLPQLCVYKRSIGLLAKYSMRPGLQAAEWRVFTTSQRDGLTIKSSIALSEDGRISPSVSLSGIPAAGNSLALTDEPADTLATLLFTWRMAFMLNGDGTDDTVEQFDFPLDIAAGNRRPMHVSNIPTETLRKVHRENFRGWRVLDAGGGGYFLDPGNSGYSHNDKLYNWTQFDLAVTRNRACEKHALLAPGNNTSNAAAAESCDASLDSYVNGETLENSAPVLWYSQSRIYRTRRENSPIISSLVSGFELLPFDWTATSPFEVTDE